MPIESDRDVLGVPIDITIVLARNELVQEILGWVTIAARWIISLDSLWSSQVGLRLEIVHT